MITTAYVGLGGNVGDVRAHIHAAVTRLRATDGIVRVALSSLYRSRPIGPVADQPDFVNAAAAVDTELSARTLLRHLFELERAAGRDRAASVPQGPRPLDLDLLLYGDAVIDEPGLRVPHPRLHERAFALVPIGELAGDALVVPRAGTIGALLGRPAVAAQRLEPA